MWFQLPTSTGVVWGFFHQQYPPPNTPTTRHYLKRPNFPGPAWALCTKYPQDTNVRMARKRNISEASHTCLYIVDSTLNFSYIVEVQKKNYVHCTSQFPNQGWIFPKPQVLLGIVDSTLIFFNYNHFLPKKININPPETKREPILSSFTIYTKEKQIQSSFFRLRKVPSLWTSQTQRLPTAPNCQPWYVFESQQLSLPPAPVIAENTPWVKGGAWWKTTVLGCCQMVEKFLGGDMPTNKKR